MITMNHTAFADAQQQSNYRKQNYAPFLAKSRRQFPLINRSQSPPIGSYQIPSCFSKNQTELQLQNQNINLQKIGPIGSAVFKSSINRLEGTKNSYPGPAEYNIIEKKSYNISQRQLIKPNHKFKFVDRQNIFSSPSIPDTKLKFGYLKGKDGKLKVFQKTINQVAEQKKKRKNYLSLLTGQKKYNQKKLLAIQSDNLEKSLKQKIKALQTDDRSQMLTQKQLKSSRSTHLKINKHRHSYNVQIKNNLSAPNISRSLGPGYYQVNLSTLKKQQKKQTFQFFGSSELRFKELVKQDQPQFIPPYVKSPTEIRAQKKAILQKLKRRQQKTNQTNYQEKPQIEIFLGNKQYSKELKKQQRSGHKIMLASKHRKNNSTLEIGSKELINIKILQSHYNNDNQMSKQIKKLKKPIKQYAFVNYITHKPSTQQFLYEMNQSRRLKQKPSLNQKKSMRDFNFGSWTPRFQSNSLSKNLNTSQYSYLQNYKEKQMSKKKPGSYINKGQLQNGSNNNPGPGEYETKIYNKKKTFNIKYVR